TLLLRSSSLSLVDCASSSFFSRSISSVRVRSSVCLGANLLLKSSISFWPSLVAAMASRILINPILVGAGADGPPPGGAAWATNETGSAAGARLKTNLGNLAGMGFMYSLERGADREPECLAWLL